MPSPPPPKSSWEGLGGHNPQSLVTIVGGQEPQSTQEASCKQIRVVVGVHRGTPVLLGMHVRLSVRPL
jgi:hypothetical protein